jgi:integrase
MKLPLPPRRLTGCSVEPKRGKLRLRWRAYDATGRPVHRAFATGLPDTPAHREALAPLLRTVAACVDRGKDPVPILEQHFTLPRIGEPAATAQPSASGHTVASYVRDVFLPYNQPPRVRRAQARDYRRHLRVVTARLGDLPLAELGRADIRGLQAELLDRRLSVKYVKNILVGSLRALIGQALDDEALTIDPFPRRLKWPAWKPPGADPFTPEERGQILGWFERKQFGLRPGPGSTRTRHRPHPAYHAFVHTLFWTGLRPSEAAGLQWQDLDLQHGRLHVQRSRHLYEDGAPKTATADRWVELFPETARVLRALEPLHVTPEQPVFTTTEGRPIEPKAFASRYWYRCLRALGLRVRGIYATKDTFVTAALQAGVKIAWLEAQTGVSYVTLKRHYGKWITPPGESELERFARLEPSLFRSEEGDARGQGGQRGGTVRRQPREHTTKAKCEEGDLNPHGCYPTSPSN